MFDNTYGNADTYEINEDAWLAYQEFIEEEEREKRSKYFRETC